MKHEYHEGLKARKNFEDTVTKLFRVPKTAIQKPPKREPKKKGDREK